MVKRSSKVLSMVMAFTMFASMFVAPNTFAAFDAQASKKANVSTYFIEKNKDGVYNRQTAYAADSPFGTIAYSNGAGGAIENPTAGNSFVVGETYNIKIAQTAVQAANYKLSDAKIAVVLQNAVANANFYDRYTEEITLKETKANNGAITYDGTFTALGSADKVIGAEASALEVYIDLERTNARAATAVANDQTTIAGDNKYKVEPLNDDGTVANSVVLQEEKDVYFKVTPSSGRYIAGANAAARQNNIAVFAATKSAPNNNLNTEGFAGGQVTVTSAAAEKGLNVYKISGENVTRLIRAVGNAGTIKLNVTTAAVGNKFIVKNSVNNYNLLDAAGNKIDKEVLVTAGTELQIQGTAQANKKIAGVTFNNGAAADPAAVNNIETYIDQGKWTVKFIVPTAPAATNKLNITEVNTADVASKKLSIAGDLAAKVSLNGTFEVSAQSGSTQTIKFVPRENYAFPETYLKKYFADLPAANNWKFDFVGLQSGALVYNVTFGTEDLPLNSAAIDQPFVPSTTQAFIPAVDFDQVLNDANGLVRFATIGNGGVVTLKNNANVVLNYDSNVAKINKVTLSGTSKSGTGITVAAAEGTGTATSQFNLTAKNGLLLSVDSAYAKGGINISDTTNGKIFASSSITGTPVVERAAVDSVVYLKVSPNKGYKLDAIKAYETDYKDTSIVKVEKTDIANTYKMTMPNRDAVGGNPNYGSSVTVEATFIKDTSLVEIKNSVPEADKAKNNGYAVISGDNYLAAGQEFVVEFVANENCRFTGANIQYKNIDGKDATADPIKTEGNKCTFKVPTDVNAELAQINVFGMFRSKVENMVPEADKAKNNGHAKISDDVYKIAAGNKFTIEFIPNDGYKLVEGVVQYKTTSSEAIMKDLIPTSVEGNKCTYTFPADVDTVAPHIYVDADFQSIASSIAIKANVSENGKVVGLSSAAEAGKEVNFKATANEGYVLDSVLVQYSTKGKEELTTISSLVDSGSCKFTVPANLKPEENSIIITVTFKKSEGKPAKPDKPADTSKPIWHETDNGWTYWDKGEQKKGWVKDETGMYPANTWFYISPKTGVLKTGWFQEDNGKTWYYSFTKEDAARGNIEGAMAANQWVLDKGKWYYLNASGAMEVNKWVKDSDDALWSWVGADGAWLYDE